MRPIQIGIEVHKAIEAERTSLSEPENDILVRLLGLQKMEAQHDHATVGGKISWKKNGVDLPHGTILKTTYSGQEVTGEIDDGFWLVGGNKYSSPSMALIHNVKTKNGEQTNLNGWNHWTVKRPLDAEFVRLARLRQ